MLDSPLIIIDSIALSIAMIISVLAAYRAFTSRRVLATPLYRNRALWTGTVALMTLLFSAWAIFIENTGSSVAYGLTPPFGTPDYYLFVILTGVFSAVGFAWIDSTIRVALEMDFLHRDRLRWKSLRPVAGIAIVAGAVAAQIASTNWELLIAVLLLAPATVYTGAALVVGGSRVRDETMRRYMRLMGFLVAAFLLQLATSYANYLNFPLAIIAYFTYAMSASLLKTAPLSVATAQIPASAGRAADQGPV